MSKLEKFLSESNLSADAKALILEAWNDEKKDLAAEIRDDMKARFEESKTKVVEGMNLMAQEIINEEMAKVYEEKRKLMEDRAVVRSNLAKFQEFSNTVLAEELQQLQTDRKALGESLAKFAQFGNTVIAEELKDYRKEKQELVEMKVKLMAEGKKKLHEAQQSWIERTSARAAEFIEEQTRAEFTQLRTQLDEANKNMFGRKIFEAVYEEFMTTQFNEHKEINRLTKAINSREMQLAENRADLNALSSKLEEAEKRVRIMEDTNKRNDIMAELTKPLTSEQRLVMEGLLEKTPTDLLQEDFKKYLKPVLNESTRRGASKATSNKAALNESHKEVTGNRQAIMEDATEAEDLDFLSDLEKMEKIAGIRK